MGTVEDTPFKSLSSFKDHQNGIRSLSAYAGVLAAASWDKTMSIRTLLDPSTRKAVCGAHTNWVNSVSLIPGSCLALSGSADKSAIISNTENGQVVHKFDLGSRVLSTCVSGDGTVGYIGCCNGKITKLSLRDGKVVGKWQAHKGGVRSLCCSSTGELVISVGSYGEPTIRFWDGKTFGLQRTIQAHTGDVLRVQLLETGDSSPIVASASSDTTCKLFSASSGECLHTLRHPGHVYCCAFLPNGGYLVTGCFDGIVRLFDCHSGTLVGQYTIDGASWFTSIAVSAPHVIVGDGNGRIHLLELGSEFWAGTDSGLCPAQAPTTDDDTKEEDNDTKGSGSNGASSGGVLDCSECGGRAAVGVEVKATTYSYSMLRTDSRLGFPAGVCSTRREEYLGSEDFEEIFGMSKEEFLKLPNAVKAQHKREVKLI
eukprot:NODE_415_length_1524_cov_120.851110_g383_i0.p1 GENE.NODE_415_length_1524_cov_120.851110_g383_i0~~NODE_415_length_1524_cov_120.851110_g383_i0.p1  ORF type:complete len:427 (-),score=71.16 NODE_415_length_1524_cov_120.851110_g383_i0:47-1327(-)